MTERREFSMTDLANQLPEVRSDEASIMPGCDVDADGGNPSQPCYSFMSSQPLSQPDNNSNAQKILDLWNQTANVTHTKEDLSMFWHFSRFLVQLI